MGSAYSKLKLAEALKWIDNDPTASVAAAQLTRKQRKFLDYVLDGENIEEAMEEAGFTTSRKRHTGLAIIASTPGETYLRAHLEMRQRLAIPLQLARGEWLTAILDVLRTALLPADKLNALKLYGQAQGWFSNDEKTVLPTGVANLWITLIQEGKATEADVPPGVLNVIKGEYKELPPPKE